MGDVSVRNIQLPQIKDSKSDRPFENLHRDCDKEALRGHLRRHNGVASPLPQILCAGSLAGAGAYGPRWGRRGVSGG
jgi:hypothetical protein